jgi:arginyl-tRNA synthetase
LKIALSGEAFGLAYRDKAPNIVCENAYQIASAFSKFYHDNHILTEEDEEKKNAWLNICAAAKTVLEKHLDVLGIEPVEKM